jgi:amino acid transporter
MKRVETWLLAVGWAGAFLFPIAGIAAGLYIRFANAPGNDGTRRYDDWSRKQAIPMIVAALVVFVLLIALNPRHR